MIDRGTFDRYVEEAFARLDDRPYLLSHPLSAVLRVPAHADAPEVLRRILLDAVDELRPPRGTPQNSTLWRRWRCLSLRYVDGVATKNIAQQLLTSERQARRDHEAGVRAVASVLWATYGQPGEAREQPRESGAVSPDVGTTSVEGVERDDIDAEVARISALSPDSATGLAGTLDEALETISPLVRSRGAEIRASLAADLGGVYVNSDVLRQILLCTLTAALHVGHAPRIDVTAVEVENAVELRVTVHRARKDPGQGEALEGRAEALVVAARRLAEPLAGSVEVVDAGDGTRGLTVRLPARPMTRVLVVDDNPDLVHLFRRFLAGCDYQLVQARTPPSAIALARDFHPHVIILDVLMPGRDGWQILQQLRAEPALRDVPVIICSILPEQPLALSLAVSDFLPKPVSRQTLLAALERCRAERDSASRRGCSGGISSAPQPLAPRTG